jgi:hypothetical protein
MQIEEGQTEIEETKKLYFHQVRNHQTNNNNSLK